MSVQRDNVSLSDIDEDSMKSYHRRNDGFRATAPRSDFTTRPSGELKMCFVDAKIDNEPSLTVCVRQFEASPNVYPKIALFQGQK